MIYELIRDKAINGKFIITPLRYYNCKHYHFSKGNYRAGCCYGKNHYEKCGYSNPKLCPNFRLKDRIINHNMKVEDMINGKKM